MGENFRRVVLAVVVSSLAPSMALADAAAHSGRQPPTVTLPTLPPFIILSPVRTLCGPSRFCVSRGSIDKALARSALADTLTEKLANCEAGARESQVALLEGGNSASTARWVAAAIGIVGAFAGGIYVGSR